MALRVLHLSVITPTNVELGFVADWESDGWETGTPDSL